MLHYKGRQWFDFCEWDLLNFNATIGTPRQLNQHSLAVPSVCQRGTERVTWDESPIAHHSPHKPQFLFIEFNYTIRVLDTLSIDLMEQCFLWSFWIALRLNSWPLIFLSSVSSAVVLLWGDNHRLCVAWRQGCAVLPCHINKTCKAQQVS